MENRIVQVAGKLQPAELEKSWYAAESKFRTAISISVGFRLLDQRRDDRFLAAFPRSGSTWLRTILTNIIDPDAKSNPDVFNKVIPDVTIRKVPFLRTLPSPRLIMTHSCWRKDIKRAVYLVRDGRDALVSYYHFHITRVGRKETFEEFFEMYLRGVFGRPWHENVESWLTAGRRTLVDNLLFVRFEELKKDTDRVIEEITTFLGLPTDSGLRVEAIEMANIKNMQKIEKKRRGNIERVDAAFYRGGKSGGWREVFTPAIEEEFLRRSAFALHLAGYRL